MRALIVLLLLAGTASAKPKLAVLGFEGERAVAKELAAQFRARVKAGPYELVPTQRELAEMKRVASCASEETECMVEIARQVGADALVYGAVERTATGYRITVKLLTENQGTDLWTEEVARGANLGKLARAAHKKLTNAPNDGVLVIAADVKRGLVYVDGVQRVALVDGKARLTMPEGSYKLRVESADKELPSTRTVTVTGDETTTVELGTCGRAEARGDEQIHAGNFDAALTAYEQGLRCNQDDPDLVAKAFLAACKTKNQVKAKRLYDKLPAKRKDTLVRACM